tara:strand:+ start:1195 stop:1389 length:195 start_codon:yes stop_codon:yes gene_type:complete
MFYILLASMAFNIILVGAFYFVLAHDTTTESDLFIMQLQSRINELELELSGVHTDVYLDEIISE